MVFVKSALEWSSKDYIGRHINVVYYYYYYYYYLFPCAIVVLFFKNEFKRDIIMEARHY